MKGPPNLMPKLTRIANSFEFKALSEGEATAIGQMERHDCNVIREAISTLEWCEDEITKLREENKYVKGLLINENTNPS